MPFAGMLKIKLHEPPAPQWVRVIEGWTGIQFCLTPMPTSMRSNTIEQKKKED